MQPLLDSLIILLYDILSKILASVHIPLQKNINVEKACHFSKILAITFGD